MIPDLSVLWVIFFVLLITTLLNLLLFKPLLAVMSKREGAVTSARALAESAAAKAQQAADEFEVADQGRPRGGLPADGCHAARRPKSAARRCWRPRATRRLPRPADAAAQLAAETAEARLRIERDSDVLAGAIAERVLGRQTT